MPCPGHGVQASSLWGTRPVEPHQRDLHERPKDVRRSSLRHCGGLNQLELFLKHLLGVPQIMVLLHS